MSNPNVQRLFSAISSNPGRVAMMTLANIGIITVTEYGMIQLNKKAQLQGRIPVADLEMAMSLLRGVELGTIFSIMQLV